MQPPQTEVARQQLQIGPVPVPRQVTAALPRQEPVPRPRIAAIAATDLPIADHVAHRPTGHPVIAVHRVVAEVPMVVRGVGRVVAADVGARSWRKK